MGKVAERRARTIDGIVAAALDVIAEEGAAGLTLGAVARRVGVRTPSLYGYFANRAALCDELFARGWTELVRESEHLAEDPVDPARALTEGLREFVAWSLANPGYAQLMQWRPIAGWEPSPEAFAPAVAALELTAQVIIRAQRAGQLDPEVDPGELTQIFATLGAGIVSQQLSNEPGVPLDAGRSSQHLDDIAGMFLTYYAPRSPE
ncbi:TetR/AcrR family transcriptional regulator [Granulicoccus phenolivorans]|uniref:TetR/AcrR family transcriptional regulator n=1 Tax=Granulicoccus phenolivorans TaxID=266854 RepID=UPI0004185527|nr:TetR/AcrR family transcriptional regulator [Granulicoccus phenolivorans]